MGAGGSGDGLRVIGAGWGRTGTLSLKVALEQLGFGPCYHMIELLKDPSRVGYWQAAQRGRDVAWRELFDGYAAAVDFPVSLYTQQLIGAFPEARVVLTVRDVDSWYESASQTIMSVRPTARQFVSLTMKLPVSRRARDLARVGRHNAVMMKRIGRGDAAKRAFEAHNARVRDVVPADRLLVYSVKEGWGPLCGFLGVPIPEAPFPRVNEREGFGEMLRGLLG